MSAIPQFLLCILCQETRLFSDVAPSKADSRKWRALEKPEYMILQRWMDAAREKLDTPGKIRRGCIGVLKRLFGKFCS